MKHHASHWIAALAVATSLNGCTESGNAAVSPPPPEVSWVVAVDLSSSRKPNELEDAKSLAGSLDKVVHAGDRMTLVRVFEEGLANSGFVWSWDIPAAAHPGVPSPSDAKKLNDASRALRAELPIAFDNAVAGKLNGTDLFSTFYRVSDIARADPKHRQRLVVISDMLQSTHDLNMESARPNLQHSIPETTWVTARAAAGQLPRLEGVCVAVVGPDVSAPYGAKLLAFWRAYFHAAGATFTEANYRNYMPDLSSMRCDA